MHTLIPQINSYGKQQIPFVLLVDFEMQCPKLYTLTEINDAGIRISFPNFTNCNYEVSSKSFDLNFIPYDYNLFLNQFNKVKSELQYGNSFLCNLTCSTPIDSNADLNEIFNQAQAPYKILVPDEWVCFSPEKFIQISNNTISTYPMKGTIDADLFNASKMLLADEKELAEHYTIVDLLRNDLSIVSNNVTVKEFRYLQEIITSRKNLLQASSAIEGKLDELWTERLGDIIASLLPAGSISGAPKQKTIEIILEAELHTRGFYTGAAFYFDGNNLDSCVLIRFIEQTKDGLVYKSGSGITINSNAASEYQELLDKIYIPI
jgi:para-aminobenzoate synthetase component I